DAKDALVQWRLFLPGPFLDEPNVHRARSLRRDGEHLVEAASDRRSAGRILGRFLAGGGGLFDYLTGTRLARRLVGPEIAGGAEPGERHAMTFPGQQMNDLNFPHATPVSSALDDTSSVLTG